MSKKSGIRIFIVDDETIVRKSLASWFLEEGYLVDTAASGSEALQRLDGGKWDIFLVDIKMPGMDGLELQRRIREVHPEATIIIMTAYASVETAVEAMKQGAHDYIVKPFEPENLEHLIQNALEREKLLAENEQLKSNIDILSASHGIVGVSPAIRRVLDEVRMLADSDASVLIRGESGTGKELVARAVHASSRRRYMPIVVVNCGALAEGVLESELFGHERGAFTGAHYQRKGKIEMSSGGSLFLDEIGDLGTKTQVDFLRVLDEKKICRVGGNASLAVDFRLIAATNRNLEHLVSEGKFRDDLYYRVNVFTIAIPPLRERREDIPALVEHFVGKFSRGMNKPISGVGEEALSILVEHEWPGNVRELRNAIERAVIVCRTQAIAPRDLSFHAPEAKPPAAGSSLADMERVHIQRTLEAADWNISRAARLLDVDRVTLYNKMRKYGVKRE